MHTGFPDRFQQRTRLFLLDREGSRRETQLEGHWFHKGGVVLKFADVDSISQAESLAGCEVQIPREERAELDEDSYYVSDLTGCTVVAGEREVGAVADVQFGAGEAPLLIVRDGAREHMVPFAKAYVVNVELAAKRIEMSLPEGMLELDAPLSAEEKRIQHRKAEDEEPRP